MVKIKECRFLLQSLGIAGAGHLAGNGDKMPDMLRRFVTDGAADIVITLAREGRMARIAVRDHGPGVPSYAEGRLFDKFFSLARPGSAKKSTGLGLSFVREIATLHQGSVEVGNAVARRAPSDPSRTDRGALAVLRLPAVKAG